MQEDGPVGEVAAVGEGAVGGVLAVVETGGEGVGAGFGLFNIFFLVAGYRGRERGWED